MCAFLCVLWVLGTKQMNERRGRGWALCGVTVQLSLLRGKGGFAVPGKSTRRSKMLMGIQKL